MAGTGAAPSYQFPGHPLMHSGLPPLPSASNPMFVVHMPKPPLAAPYDPMIFGGIPQGMIPPHPLQQLIDNLQQQAQAVSEHQTTIHLKLKKAKEALAGHHAEQSQDEFENRKDSDARAPSARKDEYSSHKNPNKQMPPPDVRDGDPQHVSYNYDDSHTTPFSIPAGEPAPAYGHRLDNHDSSHHEY